MKEYTTQNTKEVRAIAKTVTADIFKDTKKKRKKAIIVALYGDLGSGKTNFAQTVAAELGVKETVPSPTFIILRAYGIKKKYFTKFIHIDAYRLKNESELHQIGWDDIKNDPRNLILVEWADKIGKALPKDAMKIYFEFINHNTRRIKIYNDDRKIKK